MVMPSLVPKSKAVDPPGDLSEIFASEQYKASRSRVIAYIKYFEEKCSVRTEDELRRPNVITERFSIAMPTEAAYLAEIELAAGIKAHAVGELTDQQLKSVCDAYVDAHTLCFQMSRGYFAKSGNFDFWTWNNVPLFYVSSCLQDGWTCNVIQLLILKEIYADRGLKAYRL
jgi:hypothetical protein